MVVTDLPFDKAAKMDADRYALLLRPGQKLDQESDEENDGADAPQNSQEYAKFLKERERKCGPDGYVDSVRFRHSFGVKRSDKKVSESSEKRPHTTVVDLMARKERDQKDYERRLKTIEDHMWQHKQEERELKRVEGDIIKNQRSVRRSLRDYENAITRKRLTEEKKLNHGLEKYTRLQRAHNVRKEELTKQRLEHNVASEQSHKDQSRKVQLTTSDLARQYRTKISEMEVKRIEANRMQTEFETKLRTKEEEQYKLKQELAELSIALNMESQKGRIQEDDFKREKKRDQNVKINDDKSASANLENKLAKGDGDIKAATVTKRKLSADLVLTRAHLQLKQREESRHKQDTVSRLKNNREEQKQLNDAAMHAEMDLKTKQIEQRLTEHNTRRKVRASTHWHQKKDHNEAQETTLAQRHAKRFAEQQRREHEDHLKHFQKEVTKGEETEYALYNEVKNAEYTRQKQEQTVRRLNHKLLETRRGNAAKLKEEMTELNKEEMGLEQKLTREQALLAKMHASREENYLMLQKHRDQLRMDKYLLSEHEREHGRLMRIGGRTEPSTA